MSEVVARYILPGLVGIVLTLFVFWLFRTIKKQVKLELSEGTDHVKQLQEKDKELLLKEDRKSVV